MSRRKKETETTDEALSPKEQAWNELRDTFLQRCKELWDGHSDEIKELIDEDEGSKVTVAFTAAIDMAEPNAKLKTRIKFSKPYKDERLDEIGDPAQGTLGLDGLTLSIHRGDGEPPAEPTGDEPAVESGESAPEPTNGETTENGEADDAEPKKRGRGRPKKVREPVEE